MLLDSGLLGAHFLVHSLSYSLSSQGSRREYFFFFAFFFMLLISLMKAPTSWSGDYLQVPLSDHIQMGIEFQCMKLWGLKHSAPRIGSPSKYYSLSLSTTLSSGPKQNETMSTDPLNSSKAEEFQSTCTGSSGRASRKAAQMPQQWQETWGQKAEGHSTLLQHGV